MATRTHKTMTAHYTDRAYAASVKLGGWAGPATRADQEDLLDALYIDGLTATQAGRVLAIEYRLHRALSDARDGAEHFAGKCK